MSVKNPTNKPFMPFGFGAQQPGVKPAGTQVGGNPFQQATFGAQPKPIDQLGVFKSQMQSGQLSTNLNQPALPYTASRGWSA